ncbi:GNAT family N-acetyltransferase [Nocardia arizonensis]|uniref:GNAT family N-acetyltransferase n=1 Tax=Nocardia arizonensis TaxID=1141647 RepID=UPI000A5685B6|nr:GNAT family N-acetyltransferase [Nocardia arizonensis]
MQHIRAATEADLPILRDIEDATGAPFAAVGMTEVAEDEAPSLEQLRGFAVAGRAWVWADDHDRPVGYLILGIVDGLAHIDQVSVHPDHAGRRIGARLIAHAARWALDHGMDAITLTTFTEVAWNGPYYERLGFRRIPDADLSEQMRAVRAAEAAHGLDRWPRAAMSAPPAVVIDSARVVVAGSVAADGSATGDPGAEREDRGSAVGGECGFGGR